MLKQRGKRGNWGIGLGLVGLMFLSPTSSAYEIDTIFYSPEHQEVSVGIVYQGGCMEHNWSLAQDSCNILEDGSAEIAIRLNDSGWNDTCEKTIYQSFTFSLNSLSCEGRPLSLTIHAGNKRRNVLIP